MNILMVCLGNICRSPLAEGILQHLAEENQLDWHVSSAGTSNYHVGEKPHRGSIKVAREHGIDISDQKSRQFTVRDFEEYDHILVMDAENYNNVIALAPSEAYRQKVKLILNYSFPDQNRAVPDPYYTGNFNEVFDLLTDACSVFIEDFVKFNVQK